MAKIKDSLLRCDSETYLVNLTEERKSTKSGVQSHFNLEIFKQRCCRDTARHFGEIRLVNYPSHWYCWHCSGSLKLVKSLIKENQQPPNVSRNGKLSLKL